MIAFSGLTLSTKRFAEAREILVTFAKYIHNGLVPNMFRITDRLLCTIPQMHLYGTFMLSTSICNIQKRQKIILLSKKKFTRH